MATGIPAPGNVDEVQIFDVTDALTGAHDGSGPVRLEMATSPNCEITVLQASPRADLVVPVDPDADQILFVLKGACRMEGPSGIQELSVNQGVLVPTATEVRCASTSDEELVVLSMATGVATERPGYVPNKSSGVMIKVPASEIAAKGIGRHLYVFAMSRRIIGIGVNATEEWNLGSLLRMNCEFEQVGDDILVNLPERMARWYQVRTLTEADYRILPDPDHNRVRIDLTPLIEREAASRS